MEGGEEEDSMNKLNRVVPIRHDAANVELAAIMDALRGLRFGSVTVTVQDGVVVQVDRTEKNRLRLSQEGSQQGRAK